MLIYSIQNKWLNQSEGTAIVVLHKWWYRVCVTGTTITAPYETMYHGFFGIKKSPQPKQLTAVFITTGDHFLCQAVHIHYFMYSLKYSATSLHFWPWEKSQKWLSHLLIFCVLLICSLMLSQLGLPPMTNQIPREKLHFNLYILPGYTTNCLVSFIFSPQCL
jgi:hypothetical protein